MKELKRPREQEAPTDPVLDPPRKRPPKVTPIGLGAAATNRLSLPTLPLVAARVPSAHNNASSTASQGAMLPPSRVGQIPQSSAPPPTEPVGAKVDEQTANPTFDPTAKQKDVGSAAPVRSINSGQPAQDTPREGGNRDRGASRGSREPQRGAGRGRNIERGTANQRAQDKAHNDAILAQAADGVIGCAETSHEVSSTCLCNLPKLQEAQ